MGQPFNETIEREDIVLDKFHAGQCLGQAVDPVRGQEYQERMAQADEALEGTCQLWLCNPQDFSDPQREAFGALKDLPLKAAGGSGPPRGACSTT